MLALGYWPKEIATEVGFGESKVEWHIASLRIELGIGSKGYGAFALKAIEYGILEAPKRVDPPTAAIVDLLSQGKRVRTK